MKNLFFLFIVVLLGSCLLFEKRTARELYVLEARRADIGRAVLSLEKVEVVKTTETERIRENAYYILRLLFAKRTAEEKNPSSELSVRVRLKEESFLRDFKTVNTVGAEFVLFEEDPALPAALFLASEDTEETLTSYSYLYDFLRKALGRLR